MRSLNSLNVIGVQNTSIDVNLITPRSTVVLNCQSVPLEGLVLGSVGIKVFAGHFKQRLCGFDAGSKDHLGENTILIRDGRVTNALDKQSVGMIKFFGIAITHDEDSIRVDNCSKSMRNDQDSAISELLPESLLNDIIGLKIDISRGLVEHEHLRLSDNGSSHTHQLLLAHREKVIRFVALGCETFREAFDFIFQADVSYNTLDDIVLVFAMGVQVLANGTL